MLSKPEKNCFSILISSLSLREAFGKGSHFSELLVCNLEQRRPGSNLRQPQILLGMDQKGGPTFDKYESLVHGDLSFYPLDDDSRQLDVKLSIDSAIFDSLRGFITLEFPQEPVGITRGTPIVLDRESVKKWLFEHPVCSVSGTDLTVDDEISVDYLHGVYTILMLSSEKEEEKEKRRQFKTLTTNHTTQMLEKTKLKHPKKKISRKNLWIFFQIFEFWFSCFIVHNTQISLVLK